MFWDLQDEHSKVPSEMTNSGCFLPWNNPQSFIGKKNKEFVPSWWKLGVYKTFKFPSSLLCSSSPAFPWPAVLSAGEFLIFSANFIHTAQSLHWKWNSLAHVASLFFSWHKGGFAKLNWNQQVPVLPALVRNAYLVLGLCTWACTKILMADWLQTHCNGVAVAS